MSKNPKQKVRRKKIPSSMFVAATLAAQKLPKFKPNHKKPKQAPFK